MKPNPPTATISGAFSSISTISSGFPTESTNSSSDSSISEKGVADLGAPNFNLEANLVGARLNRDEILGTIFTAIVEVASWDRSVPFEGRAEITSRNKDDGDGVAFHSWNEEGPPYLEYPHIIFMLCSLVKYMYSD